MKIALLLVNAVIILTVWTPASDALHRSKSYSKLGAQNESADQYRLTRIKSEAELTLLVKRGSLVSVPEETKTFILEVEKKFQYARPWTKKFLEDIAEKHFDKFGKRLKITSLVRTEPYQRYLVKKKISDADGKSPRRRSTHLTGAALDISKRDGDGRALGQKELRWLRKELRSWERKDAIRATDEIHNNNFHVFVLPNYHSKTKEKPRLAGINSSRQRR